MSYQDGPVRQEISNRDWVPRDLEFPVLGSIGECLRTEDFKGR
jgi:hypothetical protein